MEPITHLMTGAVLARSGFNRKAAYATATMTLAAEAPDLDTLWAIRGPIAAFQHHRGWTHTLLGLPFEAALILGAIWLFHRWRSRRNEAQKQPDPALPFDPTTTPLPPPRPHPLGTALLLCSHRPAKPPPARLDQQLWPPPLLSLQPSLVRRLHRLHLRTRHLSPSAPGSYRALPLRARQQRSRRT
ncbi:metal-dependent hydrolase [Tunturiibacter gelidiferens]